MKRTSPAAPNATHTPAKYARVREVAMRYSVCEPTIWRWIRLDPEFPRPIKLGIGMTALIVAELDAYDAARKAKRDGRAAA
jgi:predicted DNA-binding transcriptional regulator AlpA